jgi:hypothetical protein
VRQLTVERERGHEPQELLAGVLAEQQWEVRLLRLGLWWVLLLLVLQLVVLLLAVLLLVAAGSVD